MGVDWCECWLMESLSLQVVLNLHGLVFARILTKCGNKGKYGRQAALHSLMVGRCARAQGLGGPYHGVGGEVVTEHESTNRESIVSHISHREFVLASGKPSFLGAL